MGTRGQAMIGNAVFFVLTPGLVVGVLPWWLTGWQVRYASAYAIPLQVLGALLVIAGAGVLVQAFLRFALEGLGTPAPVAPPQRLVVGGLYRYVRNPMYLAVVAAISGQALLLGQPILMAYALLIWLVTAAFVHWYEEPALRRQFGADYEAYRQTVPAWWPRRR